MADKSRRCCARRSTSSARRVSPSKSKRVAVRPGSSAMYEQLKATLLWLLKVPPEPHDPMGDVHSLRVFRAAPGYLRYISLGWLITQTGILLGAGVLLIPLLVASSRSRVAVIAVVALAVLAALVFLVQAGLSFFSLRLNYEMRWYKVTDRSLRIRAGVWNVQEMTMTFANVQNITISQGPLERLFGISDVKVDTAGGGSRSASHGGQQQNLHVATFRGVDNPEEIRDMVLQRLRHLRDAGLGDLEDAATLTRDSAHSPAFGNTETLDLLAAFRDEARALRRTVESASER